jgi:hypothetical protein
MYGVSSTLYSINTVVDLHLKILVRRMGYER